MNDYMMRFFGSVNDYAICNAVDRAQAFADQACTLVRQAEASSPFVQGIGRVIIASR